MSVITIQNRGGEEGYIVPAGGEILWYGSASSLPDKWEFDTATINAFVKAAGTGGASNTIQGSGSHSHTVPSTSTFGDHTHSTQTGNVGSNSGTTNYYPTANANNAKHTHGHSGQSGTSGAGGAHSHTTSNTNSEIVYPPYRKLYWIRATEDASLPVGGIVMWDDAIANIAEEFSICNGNNGTPDMRDKFVMGEQSPNSPGGTGGSETHTHSNPNVDSGGAHTHSISSNLGGPSATEKAASTYEEGVNIASDSHSHSGSGTSDTDSAHNHTLGSTGSANHVPLYIKLYFIMRVS